MKNYLDLRHLGAALFAAVLILLLSPSNASAVPIYAVTKSGKLVLFDSEKPYDFTNSSTITGLQPNESVVAIDFRPATLQLYALGSSSRLYVLNTTTGAATQVGTGPFQTVLTGTSFGFDFDPVADRARVVSNSHQNLLLHPDTGAVAAVYEPTAYAPGDVNAGVLSEVTGLAYSNNVAGATSTTLYGFDFHYPTTLVKFDPLDSGKLKTVWTLQISSPDALFDKFAAFDISDTGMAYLSLAYVDMDSGPERGFYSLDVQSGTANFHYLGIIGTGEFICGIAVNPTGLALPAPTIPPTGAPVLLREPNSPSAVALDSVTMQRDPFQLQSKNNLSSDKRTRLMLFASNVDLMGAEGTSAITAEAEDSNGVVYPLTVEFVGKVPNFDSLTQINVKLPDVLPGYNGSGPNILWVSISLRGLQSNKGRVRIINFDLG
jgi:hypothetical protein